MRYAIFPDLAQCPRLRELHLYDVKLPTADASLRFIRDCAALETLDVKLVGPQLLLDSDFARGSRDGSLRTLALQWGGEPPADLQGIALLSALHDLRLQGGPSVPPPVSVLRALSQLKQLRMLELTNAVYDLESRDAVLEAAAQLPELRAFNLYDALADDACALAAPGWLRGAAAGGVA